MKSTIKKLGSLIFALEAKIETREEFYDNKHENWQDSEKGERHLEATEKLQEIVDQANDWISELEELIN